MENTEPLEGGFLFWLVNYNSYEGNNKWFMVRTPDTWTADMVEERARENSRSGGVGDDPAEITSVETGWDDGIYQEYNDEEI